MGGILSWLAAILLAGGGALGILSLGGGLARESRRRMLPRLAAAAGAALLLLTGASLIVRWLAGTGGREPFGFFPALFAAAGILAVLLARGRKGQAASCARLCGTAVLVVFALETCLFNGNAFLPRLRGLSPQALPLAQAQLEGDVRLQEGALLFGSGGGTVTWPELDTPAAFVAFQTEGLSALRTADVYLQDDGETESFGYSRDVRFVSGEAARSFSIAPHGRLRALSLRFPGSETPLSLTAASLNIANPFAFSLGRFSLLAGVACAVLLILRLRLWSVQYSPGRPAHQAAVAAAILAALVPGMILAAQDTNPIPYPLEGPVSDYSAHIQQFDAFQKGQICLDLPVDPRLATMENPYDTSARNALGVSYHWDRAFFGGRYYSYFGVVPVLLAYYPFYWITGSLPANGMICGFFALLAAVFLCGLVLELVRLFGRRVNLLLLLIGLPAAVAASTLYGQQGYADMYFIPVTAGTCFLMLALFLSLRACRCPRGAPRLALLAGAGAAFALTLGCRPTMALFGAAVLPLFLRILRDKETPHRHKAACAAAFALPALIGAAALLWYNRLRFGSFLDFGVAYQLTVSDPSANTLRLSNLFPSLYHYGFQPFDFSVHFPFLLPSFRSLNLYGRYVYLGASVGALSFPAVAAGLTLLPMALSRRTLPGGPPSRYTRGSAWLLAATAALVAFVDFSMAGVNIRYMADILPPLAALCVPALLLVHRRASRSLSLRGPAFAGGAALLAATFFAGLSLAFPAAAFGVWAEKPEVYAGLERLVFFWL